MADSRPHLEVVDGGDRAEPTPEAPAEGRGGRWLPALLAVLLLLALAAWWAEGRRAGRLEADVARLAAELSDTRGALQGHRAHLSELRGAVEALGELVQRDPEAGPVAEAPPP